MQQTQYDAIVIGAGHNGLVMWAYLANEGLKVLVLERLERVGGAVVSEEPSPVSPSKCCELGSIEIYQSAPGNRTATVVVKRLTADPSPSPHNAKAQRPVQPVAGFLCLSALGGVSS